MNGNGSLRVVVFARTTEIGPSTRYRFTQHRARLAAEGVELDVRPLFGPTWFRIRRVRSRALRVLLACAYAPIRLAARLVQRATIGAADRVIVEHQLFPYLPAWIELALLRRGRFVLEFDDAIWLTPMHRRKLAALARAADRVVVGNEFLAAFARRCNERVDVIPTSVDVSRYPAREPRVDAPRAARPFVVGWIGLPINFPALESIAAPLARLAREIPLVVRVISAGRPDLPGVTVEPIEWNEATETRELARLDAGVMPLPDDEWSRGKCGLKVLQYFAASVPVVAAPVGVNAEIVRDRENGLLARSEDEWHDRLRELAKDRALAERLAAAGRATVERDFAAATIGARIAAAWRAARSWR